MTGEAIKLFGEAFERERKTLPGAGLDWLLHRREEAFHAFAKAGLPHRRLEDWRYTDLAQALDRAALKPAPFHEGAVHLPDAATRPSIGAFDAVDRHVLLFVNGRMRSEASLAELPEGVEIAPLGRMLDRSWARVFVERHPSEFATGNVIALNTALMGDGAVLHVRRNVKLDKPLHLVFLAVDEGAFHTRHLIRLDEGAEATIFETHIDAGGGRYFADHVTDVSLAPSATLLHVKLQDEGRDAIHLASMSAELDTGAQLSTFSLTLGGAISRAQTFVRFVGENAVAHVNGAMALRGRQHGDHFVAVDHAVPHCSSDALFKTVLDEEATGVFQGKVVVREDAQKTDGRQMTNALLLSRDAVMNAKPELEIYADDVQCAHGSTVGELNPEALFYLRSRGIDETTARQLLISAFLDETLERLPHEAAREALRRLVANWFGAGAES